MKTLQSIIDGLSDAADKPALIVFRKHGSESVPYRKLAGDVRRLAGGLIQAGVGAGDCVVLLSGPRPEWVLACLAVLGAGGVAVPLDAQMDAETLSRILDDCGARYIFTESGRMGLADRLDPEKDFRLVLLDADREDERSWRRMLREEEADFPSVGPDDRAALFYTSGTTGPPKGVPLTHANLLFQIDVLVKTGLISGKDRVLVPLPFHHVYPFVIGMLAPLALGAPIILPGSMTGPEILRALRDGEATILVGVPRLYSALYESIRGRFRSRGAMAGALFDALVGMCARLGRRTGMIPGRLLLHPLHRQMGPNLRILASGGSTLDPQLAEKLWGMGWQVGVGYGLTETAPLLTLNLPGKFRVGSVGLPVPGVELRIDPSAYPQDSPGQSEASSPCGNHGKGEVLARGPNVFSGYHNLPDITEESFTNDGWFRTGDLGCLDGEGYLYLFGRVSTLIVTQSGENIQPEGVEASYEQSPFIREIGILEKGGRLVAVIVPETGEIRKKGFPEIRDAVRRAVEEQSRMLPSYCRISDFALTPRPLDRTRLGKIQRHILPERYEMEKSRSGRKERGPISVREMAPDDRLLLENPAARKVWKQLSRRYPDHRLTPDTSPQLELGIDSMEWLELTLAIGRETGVELEEKAIARMETVRDLLGEVAQASQRGRPARDLSSLFENPESLLQEGQKRWLRPLEPWMISVVAILFAAARLIMGKCFRLKAEGVEHLPRGNPFVLVPNHLSYLDPFAVAAALGFSRLRQTYWGGWTGVVFGNPFTRFFSRLAQIVPVDPEQGVVSSIALAAAVLKRRKNLVWFPEGERSPSGKLQAFRPGIGLLLDHLPVIVVPARIRGSHRALPPGSFFKGFYPITVTFGRPLDPEDLKRQGKGEKNQERIVRALHDRVSAMG